MCPVSSFFSKHRVHQQRLETSLFIICYCFTCLEMVIASALIHGFMQFGFNCFRPVLPSQNDALEASQSAQQMLTDPPCLLQQSCIHRGGVGKVISVPEMNLWWSCPFFWAYLGYLDFILGKEWARIKGGCGTTLPAAAQCPAFRWFRHVWWSLCGFCAW